MAPISTMATSNGRPLKSQYHHYLPRFMLRKWKVEFDPPVEGDGTTQTPYPP